MQLKLIILIVFSSLSFSGFTQIIGGSGNSEMTPKEAEPSTLSAGEFGGQVSTVNGGFNASVNLGSVSTPGGINFSLNMSYSSSFAVGNTQPMTEGIPYGEGWGPNIPTISVETDVLQKFTCNQLRTDGQLYQDLLDYYESGEEFNGEDQGDLYWFAPILNIPGVGSGRAVFKYIDEKDSKCMVFVLNKFESPIEIRYYGGRWKIILQDGTVYSMGVHLVNYRAPANDRIIFYDQADQAGLAKPNQLKEVVNKAQDGDMDSYGQHRTGIQNVIEPKVSYSVWYCTNITNPNLPLQGVVFEYEKYGKFNFFKEFLQNQYGNVKTKVLLSSSLSTPNDYSAYSDVLLTKVSSYVHESKVDVIDLEYKTNNALADNGIILNPDHPDVTPVSNLYNRTIEASYGLDGDPFENNWTRYVHHKRDGNYYPINPENPYLNNSNSFLTEQVSELNQASFNHGFLESERLFNLTGNDIYPGDIYEINTVISRNNSTDLQNGNGTVDIAVVTGTLGNSPNNESNTLGSSSVSPNNTHFQNTKGVELFSTFNRAFKWTMGYGSAQLETSNAFVMPNFPSTYQGLNIQVGPGNSDINYASSPENNSDFLVTGEINAIAAYPFTEGSNNAINREITSTNRIGHNFGTGHPWSMMIPIYNMMTLNSPSLTGAAYSPTDLYDTWWSDENNDNDINWDHSNIPTKFDDNVKLEKVELIRYSKNAYMLNAVKVYKVNGEFSSSPLSNDEELKLVSQKKFEYEKKIGQTIKNYDYMNGDPIRMEPTANRKRIVILLKAVRNIPTSGDVNQADYGVSDTSSVQTTFLGYSKLLDNQNNNSLFSDDRPFIGITKYVLNRYIDHLGGITEVKYYPVEPNSPSGGVTDYTPDRCGATSSASQPMGARSSYTVHPVVKYLAKNNEGDFLTQPNSGPLPNSGAQVWHYKYSRDHRMAFSESFNFRDVRNHISYFRGDYRNRTDIAFSTVEVEGPALNTSERITTEYKYFGNPSQESAIDAYMFFGKPKSVKSYDVEGKLESEKLYEYESTKAFSNAYERPNPIKGNMNYHNQVMSSYEYEDIYLDDPFSVTVTSGSVTNTIEGSDAYPYISNNGLNGSGKPQEYPKFFTFHFYDEFKSVFPEYMFHSYFIKTKSVKERVYEKGLSKNIVYEPLPADPVYLPLLNPHGSGLSNPIEYRDEELKKFINLINTKDEEYAHRILIDESPLADTILNYLVNNSRYDAKYIIDILIHQEGLTNDVFNNLIKKRKFYPSSSMLKLIEVQPYFSDSIQNHLISNINKEDDLKIVESILLKNKYLSTEIILALTRISSMLPSEIYQSILRRQKQQPYSVLGRVIAASDKSKINLDVVLSNQQLNDSLFNMIIYETSYDSEVITSLIESNKRAPSDEVLTNLLKSNKSVSENQFKRIFSNINRPLTTTLKNLLYQLYKPILVDFVIGNQLDYHCDNDLSNGRLYIESKKEFEYYEADFEGKAIGKAYEMLFGFISSTEEPSAFPRTVDFSGTFNDLKLENKEVDNIYLKHEPSWQLFSVKSSSPHQPGAYTKNEKYYLYDLQNRYDRHWYLYDFSSSHFGIEVFPESEYGQPYGGNDTLTLHNQYWPLPNQYYPQTPSFDGMNKSREYNNKSLAFQDVSISKNSNSESPVINSEFYRHDSRWSFDYDYESLDGGDAFFDGDPCGTPGNNSDCQEVACTDCYEIYPTGGQTYDDLVPVGYCLWYTTSGQFVCPEGVNLFEHGFDVSEAQMEWCNEFLINNEEGEKMMPIPDILSKTLQMRSVYVQLDTLDHSTEQEFNTEKWDQKNHYIAEFSINLNTSSLDEYGFEDPYEIIPPFENMRTNHVLERSNYFLPELEENQIGLQTKYYYFQPKRITNINSNCSSDKYISMLNKNIGKPVRICVGYNKEDSLSTAYSYNDIGQIKNIFSPDGQSLSYEYDDYNRLTQNVANNERQLNSYEYSYWQHNFNDWFEQRTDQNYVKTTIFNSDPTLSGNELDKEIQKGFMDPLGRSFSKVSAYLTSPNDRVEIHSGTVEYDNWNRKFKSYKNHVENNPASNAINSTLQTSTPFEEVVFEKSPKSRPLRSSNYGVDVQGIHAIKNKYYIANYIYTSCELGLSKYELNLIMRSSNISNFRFYRSITFDQDDKKTIEYTNASGQKVATLQYGENSQKIVTLFVYDDYGNLTKTINPEKQETDYIYNSLGLMVEENTVDAGSTKFMYNKQGLVSHIRNMQTDDFEDGPVKMYTRKMHYDDFGRLRKVERRDINADNFYNGKVYDGFYYEDELVGTGIDQPISTALTSSGQFYFEYKYTNRSSLDWLNQYKIWWSGNSGGGGMTTWDVYEQNQEQLTNESNFSVEKENGYSEDVNTNKIGKLEATTSYDALGNAVQRTNYTYDDYGNVAVQEIIFNPNTPVGIDPATDMVSKIEYPAYNYRGSLLEEKIDIKNDGTVDFHCFMDYDALNRLVGIYAAIGEVTAQSEATLVVSYKYNDAIGTVDKKTHYVEENQLAAIANEISYSYDERNRLTNITAQKPGLNPVMDYDLFYDDQTAQYSYGGQTETVAHDENWNGNINGTSMKYNFNSMSGFITAPNDMVKPLLYGYSYDPINRMTQADATVGDFLQTGSLTAESYQVGDLNVNYDKIGNIKSLHRTLLNGDTDPTAPYLAFDHFNYNYSTANNHLLAAQGASGTTTRNYEYDEVGNLLTDDARNITSTAYSRTAYPFNVTLFENETTTSIDYLYSIDDQRIYKKHTDNLGTSESYYLRDAFGKTVAIYSRNPTEEKWSYFVSGSERECEITPQENGEVAIGVDMSKFYLYDHLGNTRITYTPDKIISTSEKVLDDQFLYGSFDGWEGEENTNGDVLVDLNNPANGLEVTVEPQAVNGVSKQVDYLPGGQFAYDVTINVNLGTTSGVDVNISNALPGTQTITQSNTNVTFTITPSNTNSILSILPTDNLQTHNFTINSIKIEKANSSVTVTSDDIIQVVDYYPYGKVLREYVNGDHERYLTTQHERDQVTGLDYRGARYYDADVARFLSIDPWQDKYPAWSTYNYVMGNPVKFIDPTGKGVEYSKKTAEAMAARGEENGYTTQVVANPDEEGDFGVSFTKEVDGRTYRKTQFNGNFTGIGKSGLVPNQGENKRNVVPELNPEVVTGANIGTSALSNAAEETIMYKPKYKSKIPSTGGNQALRTISNGAVKLNTVVTVVDKGTKVTNALMKGDNTTAGHHAVTGGGYVVAGAMMAAPTGITQIAGGVMFIGIAIYDIFAEPEPK